MRASAGCLGALGAWIILLAWLVLTHWPAALCWGVGLTVAGFAVVWPLRRRERLLLQRWMDDKCVECGYDLRGIGRSGRCPECGSEFDGVSPELERDSDQTSA